MKGELKKWVLAKLHAYSGQASRSELKFLNERFIEDVIGSVSIKNLPHELMAARIDPKNYDDAFGGDQIYGQGQGAVLEFMAGYYGDMHAKLSKYFASIPPELWSLEFLEMVSESGFRCQVFEDCRWRGDRESCIAAFKRFVAVLDPDEARSDEFWRLLFDIFTPAFYMFQEWDNQGLNWFSEPRCPEYMRGVVKMAKQGVTPDQFETYMKP